MWNTIIGQNPTGPCKLQVLNLSDNGIGIAGAKLLASAFEHNNSIEYLDLSSNDLQVYGSFLLSQSLKKNNKIKGLNLFKNLIDVDGARHIKSLLLVNKTIEFLDLGHNRIRGKGLEAIAEAINQSETCKLKTLGIRMNFISDDNIQKFFNETVFAGIGKLENIHMKFNNLTQGKCQALKAKLDESNSKLYVDEFERLVHINDEQRKKSSLWLRVNSNVTG